MLKMQYRYILVSLREEKPVNDTLDEWSKAGWELHSSNLAQLGSGYGIEGFVQLIWQRPRQDDA